MSESPFSAPAEPSSANPQSATVVAFWALCGGAMGTSLGLTAQLMGGVDGASAKVGLSTGGGMALLAVLAVMLERRWARERPEILDHKGRPGRPLSGWLYGIPMALTLPLLVWLAVLGSIATDSLAPAFVFGGGVVMLLLLGRRIYSNDRMARALESLARGDAATAEDVLVGIATAWWATNAARATAELNVALLCTQRGALGQARAWYMRVRRGSAEAYAEVGLALLDVVEGNYEAASARLARALTAGGAAVQGQSDAVRLLLVLRTDGPDAARELGMRLLSPNSGSLFRGVLWVACEALGDVEGQHLAVGAAERAELARSGAVLLVPELSELLVA